MNTHTSSQSFRSNRFAVVIILVIVAVLGALALNRQVLNPAPPPAPQTIAEAKGQDFDTVWNYALSNGKENYAIRWGDVESAEWGTVTPGSTYTIPTARCRQYTLRTVTKEGTEGKQNTKIEYGRACTSQGSPWKKVQ